MTSNMSNDIQRRFSNLITDVMSNATRFHWTQDEIHKRLSVMYSSPAYEKAPYHVKTYLQGLLDAKRESLWDNHLVWLFSVDGELLTDYEVNARTDMERVNMTALGADYKSPWQRVRSDQSRHVYRGIDMKPLRNKPFDAKFGEPICIDRQCFCAAKVSQ